MLKTVLVTTLAALFLSLLLPAFLGALVAGAFSGLSILDPLYAGERSSGAWSSYWVFSWMLGLHVIVTTPLVSATIYWFRHTFQSRWFLVVAAILSLLAHFLLSTVYLQIGLRLFGVGTSVNGQAVLGAVSSVGLIGSPLIGILAAWLARRENATM